MDFHLTNNFSQTRRRVIASTLALLAMPAWPKGALDVIHQGPEAVGDTRNDYYWQMLEMVLSQTREKWGEFRVLNGPMMNGARAAHELEAGTLNIIVRSTSKELESRFRPIRIPLDKGLLGYRVFIIRRELQAQLDQVRTLDDLIHFTIGQSRAWNDVGILEKAGFKVVVGDQYQSLFSMLSAGRFDLFSRSVTEAGMELQARQQQFPNLTIERGLALYYPLPHYLFARRDAAGEKLATRIEEGFELMLKDGSFNRLFSAYKIPFENAIKLKDRRLFRIANPLLPDDTPLGRSELWYDPTR